jgi:hypothetical protein
MSSFNIRRRTFLKQIGISIIVLSVTTTTGCDGKPKAPKPLPSKRLPSGPKRSSESGQRKPSGGTAPL